jgi:wyosine [tRNA(Phe)-imidazoG37] synthetase (radical SAM superfamily)
MERCTIVFGPVPSRRLGQSLGINNIPPKNCSYSCVYCQVGRTVGYSIELQEFYRSEDVVSEVAGRVQEIRDRGESVDFLTFVPDGEPTLDVHLGVEIQRLRDLGIPIAVISNGSLLWRTEVRSALRTADWVSLKVDSVREDEWRSINRPHRALQLGQVLEGMLAFAREFSGELATETMLIRDQNDGEAAIGEVVAFVARLRPRTAYIGIPTRPTAEKWASPTSEEAVTRAYQQFAGRLPRVELLTGYEGTAFGASDDPAQDLLSITAVHPMREDAVRELLRRAGSGWSVVEGLMQRGDLERVEYREHRYYVRRFLRARPGDE